MRKTDEFGIPESSEYIEELDTLACQLEQKTQGRYPQLPAALWDILAGIDECISPDSKAWLLCSTDYQGNTNSEYQWNEFENQSLIAAEGNEEWEKEIVAFWNKHFPFLYFRSGWVDLTDFLTRLSEQQ